MGPDRIHLRILKELADVIAKPLFIFEWFWESREIPKDWKVGDIILIFKGKREDPESYRPVSLISVPGKIMKKTLLGDTEKLLEDNAAISPSQHSFMRGKSCLLNMISFYYLLLRDEDGTLNRSCPSEMFESNSLLE
ncbi:hypothetical protein DUI87_09095 [Hirundo rustica rustica]|uniref:Reverse transcriptase domain-containing protein n=1 Tax=Hirundo rustica rustica TaxID=333673 RepID=A0A3M0KL74_HIRRU|nr:hypothetical protein DUI87_09095 [Hirundo rustica rustica]